MTSYSLYAAVSIGWETDDLIAEMRKLCKHKLPDVVVEMIEECTLSYGKVKLVLKHNRYFIESSHSDVVQTLLKDRVIQTCMLDETPDDNDVNLDGPVEKKTKVDSIVTDAIAPKPTSAEDDIDKFYDKIMKGEDEDENAEAIRKFEVLTFEIKPNTIEIVQKRCIEMKYPLLAEYDFRNDTFNPNLSIDLKPNTQLRLVFWSWPLYIVLFYFRPYQELSLRKMFSNSRARSGVIVLPCGAGKTLVGVTAATTINKRCLCLATSNVSVEQWRSQFKVCFLYGVLKLLLYLALVECARQSNNSFHSRVER